jgi:hypothetical protein
MLKSIVDTDTDPMPRIITSVRASQSLPQMMLKYPEDLDFPDDSEIAEEK